MTTYLWLSRVEWMMATPLATSQWRGIINLSVAATSKMVLVTTVVHCYYSDLLSITGTALHSSWVHCYQSAIPSITVTALYSSWVHHHQSAIPSITVTALYSSWVHLYQSVIPSITVTVPSSSWVHHYQSAIPSITVTIIFVGIVTLILLVYSFFGKCCHSQKSILELKRTLGTVVMSDNVPARLLPYGRGITMNLHSILRKVNANTIF